MPPWRNWQTRMIQVHVPARAWWFDSTRRHLHKLEFRPAFKGLAAFFQSRRGIPFELLRFAYMTAK